MTDLAYGFCDFEYGIVLFDRGNGIASKYRFDSKEELEAAMSAGGWKRTLSKPLMLALLAIIGVFILLHILEGADQNTAVGLWLNQTMVNNLFAVILILLLSLIGVIICMVSIKMSVEFHDNLMESLDHNCANRFDFIIKPDIDNVLTVRRQKLNWLFNRISLILALVFVGFLLSVILFFTTEFSLGGVLSLGLFINILVVAFGLISYYNRYKIRDYHFQRPILWK